MSESCKLCEAHCNLISNLIESFVLLISPNFGVILTTIMKKKFLKYICLFAITIMCGSSAFSQDTMRQTSYEIAPPLFSGTSGFRTWSIGIHGGAMAPFAATGGRNDFSNWQTSLGYGIYIKKQVSHIFGLQADFMRGTLKANNDKLWVGLPPISPYSSFKTDVHYTASLSVMAVLGNISWSQLHTAIQPYVSVGGGVINFNPNLVTSAGVAVNFKPTGSINDFYVPVGFGLKANLSNRVNLDLGYTMGFVDGDELDGYFKEPIMNDRFSYLHAGLEFSLGSTSKPQLARHNPPAQLSQNVVAGYDELRASLAASEDAYNKKLAEFNMMKKDSDFDGVSDYFDKCPNTPQGVKVDGAGCALPVPPPPVKDTVVEIKHNTYIITAEDKKIISDAIRNLEFDFGKSTIRAHSLPYLDRTANLLITKGIRLKLSGHTDNVGSDAYNLQLSKNRAEAVMNYLVSKGANPSVIEAIGYGEERPIASNKNASGRQLNRRVEFNIY
jgi:OOP family OmpA-OmpF porin